MLKKFFNCWNSLSMDMRARGIWLYVIALSCIVMIFACQMVNLAGSMMISTVFLCFFIVTLLSGYVIYHNIRHKEEKEKLMAEIQQLKKRDAIFQKMLDKSPIGIALINHKNGTFKINSRYAEIVGRTKQDLQRIDWRYYTHPEDLNQELTYLEQLKSGEISSYSVVKRFIRADDSLAWVKLMAVSLESGAENHGLYYCLVEDIGEYIRTEEELKESERSKSVLLSNLPGMTYRYRYDLSWTMEFVSQGCLELTGYEPEHLINNRGLSFIELIDPAYRGALYREWSYALAKKTTFRLEYEIINKSGEARWVLDQGQGVFNELGHLEALEGTIIDITELKRREREIQHLNYHDFLTDLYNRRFLDYEKQRLDAERYLPLSVIIGDIDGVKMINDAFGHAEGDVLIVEAARIFKACCREQDVIARTGGDEFTILLPKTDSITAYRILKDITRTIEEYNKENLNETYNLHISLGYATKNTLTENLDATIKLAEDYMYKRKLLEHKSSHSALLSSIKATMFEKSQETEEHAERLVALTRKIGQLLNLSELQLYELELLSALHDIGKVGVDDRILKKPGKLIDEEWIEMKKHTEIGFRIAMASPDLVSIAECILCHHERWDGNGYPQGLKAEEIPLLSRILAVADAYDAMTENRAYRKAMSRSEAIMELKRNAGTQFDPEIVKLFIKKVVNKPVKSVNQQRCADESPVTAKIIS